MVKISQKFVDEWSNFDWKTIVCQNLTENRILIETSFIKFFDWKLAEKRLLVLWPKKQWLVEIDRNYEIMMIDRNLIWQIFYYKLEI